MPEFIKDENGNEVEVRVVEAVAISANVGHGSNSPFSKGMAKFIEMAMTAAANECMATGITEPTAVRKAMMRARNAAKKHFEKSMAEFEAHQLRIAAEAAEREHQEKLIRDAKAAREADAVDEE